MVGSEPRRRDELIALMVAERDAELRRRGPVQVVKWPDDENRGGKTVELIARTSSGSEVVVEHTRIESYPEQIADRLAVHGYFPGGGPRIPGRNDAGKFSLSILPGSTRGLTRRQRRLVPSVLTTWVAENLDRAPWPHNPSKPTYLVGTDPDLPFEWVLWRWIPDHIGLAGPDANIVPIRAAQPRDLESLRLRRLDQALNDKVPKLLGASHGHRRSILVLEDRDPELSGPLVVSAALQTVVNRRSLPDVIYLMYTRGCDPIMGALYEDQVWAHEHHDFHWETFPVSRCGELNAMPVAWA